LLGGLVFSLPIANAAPLAINQGGTGNTFGLPSQYAIVPNASPGTATNLLVKYNYANTTHTAQTAAIGDTAVVGVCVAGCGSTGNATIQTGGYADCKFDNTTTVGDFVQIATSTGNDGDCTDAGATAPTSGQVIGQVLTANTGAGTTSTVQLSLTPSTSNTCTFCRCIPSSPVTCQNASWTTFCSCNLGPFIHDPGPGNTWIDIDQNVIDFTKIKT
jgi:hypothetical protein